MTVLIASAASSAVNAVERSCPSMPIEKPARVRGERVILSVDNGRPCVPDGSGAIYLLQTGPKEQAMMAHRGVGMRQCIGRLDRDRTFEQHQRLRTCSGMPESTSGWALKTKS